MFNKLFLASVSAILLLGGVTLTANAAAETSASGALAMQEDRCSGVVIDNTGMTVIGASVVVKGTTNGVSTGVDGDFVLTNVNVGDVLQISCIGYVTKEVVWDGSATLRVVLDIDSEMLAETVVVGFGTQKKVNLTGAVSTVDSKTISSRPINNVVDALQGTVPGMNISTSSSGGVLNASKNINIRGTGTIGSGSSVSPLVLIDGMEGDMNTLNPQDIESISVLKDASASSIYGSRAAGGVILITTKSGKAGKVSINYNNSFRFNSPLNMPEMMDSYTWALYMNEASVNSGQGVWFTESYLNKLQAAMNDPSLPTMFANSANQWEVWDVTDILPVANTDWLEEMFGNSFSQEHTFSAQGGSEKMRFYFSANYLGQNGALNYGNDNRQRYAITGKINAKLTDWAELTYNIRFNRTDYDAPRYMRNGTDEFYHNMCRYWPIVPVKDPNGHYVRESYVERLTNGGRYKTQSDVIAQQVALRLTPLEGLVINAELNYRVNTNFNHNEALTTYAYDVDGVAYVADDATTWVTEYAYKSNYFNPNVYAEYSRSFGDHNFKIMGGFQSEYFRYRNISASQYGILAGLPTLDTTSDDPQVSGGYQDWATAGFFGRFNYDYKSRYMFEANIRYDGSSRFLENNRWSFFPSFSAGWNIAEESFMEDLKPTINMLKLRASWGRLGNQNTDSWYPFYPTIGYSAGGGNWLVGGEKPNISAQPSLVSALMTWEKSQTWEVGLDWGLFDDRLTGSFGYFQRKTYDMVGPAEELPDVLGAAEPSINNLDMTSKGWDLQISWRDYIDDFNYGISLTLSDNIVVVDSYPNDSKNLSYYYDGRRLGDIWGYTTVGIANSQAEMDAHLATTDQSRMGSGWGAGDIMYKDLDGDGVITTGEYTLDDHGDISIIGNSTPRYNFGLNFDFAWKGFDLKVFFQGTLKRDYAAGGSMFWGASGISKWQALGFTYHEDHWTEDNTDAYYPKANWSGSRNNYTQTRYLQNAAYCRLKNLTLGYTLPKHITEKAKIENLRFFVSGENLLTFTNFTEAGDPELIGAGYGGNIGKTYPLSKTFSCGLSITF